VRGVPLSSSAENRFARSAHSDQHGDVDALEAYFDSLVGRAETAVGHPLWGRTAVCPDASRDGTRLATSYPTPSGTVVWVELALVDTVTRLLDDHAHTAITTDRWLEIATDAGAEHTGSGNNWVLVGDLRRSRAAESGIEARSLDRDDADDVERLRRFAESVPSHDLDDVDFDLNNLDPFIVGLFDGDTMVAYSSGLPDDEMTEFDDIAVITRVDRRARGLGARVVAEFVERRTASDPARRMLYRCNIDNMGSNGVANSLGFTLANTIGAVRLPE
jgi:hypothetical protein